MTTPQIIFSVIVVIAAVLLTAIVLFQSGKSSGLTGAFGGNSDTYLGKNRASGMDAKLARYTKWIALVFVVAVLVLNLI
ncbi:MAG: preprotein translocase subunit SecG [Oscillospiraceae bacterium]|nr:preprotein translocase subunit SecG [Oscillospiraceae bacterium]